MKIEYLNKITNLVIKISPNKIKEVGADILDLYITIRIFLE